MGRRYFIPDRSSQFDVTRCPAVVLKGLSVLINQGRVVFPREVVAELERYQGADKPALVWAKSHVGLATKAQPSFESVASVLAQVPEVLDPDKDGVEEADPYVLAMALELLNQGPMSVS